MACAAKADTSADGTNAKAWLAKNGKDCEGGTAGGTATAMSGPTDGNKNTGTYGLYGNGGTVVPPVTTTCGSEEYAVADGCVPFSRQDQQWDKNEISWSSEDDVVTMNPRMIDDLCVTFLHRHAKVADFDASTGLVASAYSDTAVNTKGIGIKKVMQRYIQKTDEYKKLYPNYSYEKYSYDHQLYDTKSDLPQGEKKLILVFGSKPSIDSWDTSPTNGYGGDWKQ